LLNRLTYNINGIVRLGILPQLSDGFHRLCKNEKKTNR
jgi:hypothetical protein